MGPAWEKAFTGAQDAAYSPWDAVESSPRGDGPNRAASSVGASSAPSAEGALRGPSEAPTQHGAPSTKDPDIEDLWSPDDFVPDNPSAKGPSAAKPPSSGFCVAYTRKRTLARLHYLGKVRCSFTPSAISEYKFYGEIQPPSSAYDLICRRCWPDPDTSDVAWVPGSSAGHKDVLDPEVSEEESSSSISRSSSEPASDTKPQDSEPVG